MLGTMTYNLDASWTYDNEGRVTLEAYPAAYDFPSHSKTTNQYSYTYDAMGRPSSMAIGPSGTGLQVAQVQQYNASDQIKSWTYGQTPVWKVYLPHR